MDLRITFKLSYLLIITLLVFSGCQKEKAKTKENIRPVKYYEVTEASLGNVKIFSGIAKSYDEAKVSFRVGGTILKIKVKPGDKVKKDQILAILDSEPYKLQLNEANASLKNLYAKANLYKATYKRVQALYENQNASEKDLDEARTGYEVALAGIKAAKAKAAQAKLQIEYTVLKSPGNGEVAYKLLNENENVSAGHPVLVVNYGGELEVEIGVPDSYINRIKKGMDVKLGFSDISKKEYSGTIKEVGISPSEGSPTYPVKIILKEKDGKIKQGMVARVKVNLSKTDENFLIVPSTSVFDKAGKKYLFLLEVEKDSEIAIVKEKEVKIEGLTDNGFKISKGIKLGDKIVSAGVNLLADNMKVKVLKKFGAK